MSFVQRDELLKDLAVALYARDALSFSKACELSKLDRVEFGRLLALREVPRHYGEEELERDWKFASAGEDA
jgi:predicted HTH domain antitoxin